jgi:hypothetical protein
MCCCFKKDVLNASKYVDTGPNFIAASCFYLKMGPSCFWSIVFLNTGQGTETESFVVQDPKIWTKKKKNFGKTYDRFLFCDVHKFSIALILERKIIMMIVFIIIVFIVRQVKGNWFPGSNIKYWIFLRRVLNVNLWIYRRVPN